MTILLIFRQDATRMLIMLLPDETYEQSAGSLLQLLHILEDYDSFLQAHRIRPEFFCRYREKQLLHRKVVVFLREFRRGKRK
ncbi:hypothetical protein GWI33_018699 [Rhynchophorus ferrugineus]|uniref:Uncharacterized protein n=1 Tax=Rhynchophorus ferrugineus TaxID=354439 RepID=A0A834M177_RHYFE|nr:hypothetical protein GWI33_018699 [Rhynchophorus ferrugineus]